MAKISNTPDSGSGFVYCLHNPLTHQWIHIDGADTYDVWQAKRFTSTIAAADYATEHLQAKSWEVRKLDIEVRDIIKLAHNEPMESYYCTIRSAGDDYRRELRFSSTSFDHAEEQAKPYLEKDEEIIRIERDYKV